MQQAAMIATRPVFIGDDHTDEAGFRAVAAMDGAGILVGPLRTRRRSINFPRWRLSMRGWMKR
jgi:trehalose 6-phosphate phosphatase